ncbi:hypothetical protein SASPL_143043 [Salvia splendens]|uniref:Methionine-gamma-lyase n=1 Tax=Salvia splendens TaxID=180675 RepID=A0A8X8WK63_SALSN|nr:hypothetical protein SASPL_143043 [Salvia splendens]
MASVVSSNEHSGSSDNHCNPFPAATKDHHQPLPRHPEDPAAALANSRHEFGEHGGVNMSIEASATFTVMEPETMRRMFTGELGPDRDFFFYSRHFNPTVLNLGRLMASLEGTEAAYCTASGMSAVSSVLLQLCSAGGHVVASRTLYGGTHTLLTHFLPRTCNITTSFVDIRDHEALCRMAHDKGITAVVDNTFAPMFVSPARLGADIVVHSMSKFISGAADLIAVKKRLSRVDGIETESWPGTICHDVLIGYLAPSGAVCGPESFVNSLMDTRDGSLMLLGPTMNPKVAFELAGRLPHLGLRMKEHCNRALVYATRMKKLGLKVIYPGLEDHPDHATLKSMAIKEYGYGGLLCVDMETEERANRLMKLLQNCSQFGLVAVSLGYYDTLMSCSGSSTSSELSKEEKEQSGISPGLIRMSIGFNGTLEQKWSQFEMALSRMQDSTKV